jgi:hypothetical protein
MSRMKECSKDFKVVTEDEVLSGTGKGWEEWSGYSTKRGSRRKGTTRW